MSSFQKWIPKLGTLFYVVSSFQLLPFHADRYDLERLRIMCGNVLVECMDALSASLPCVISLPDGKVFFAVRRRMAKKRCTADEGGKRWKKHTLIFGERGVAVDGVTEVGDQ